MKVAKGSSKKKLDILFWPAKKFSAAAVANQKNAKAAKLFGNKRAAIKYAIKAAINSFGRDFSISTARVLTREDPFRKSRAKPRHAKMLSLK